ncbi:MAG: hypothetical protein AAGG02_08160 [Cyanobacteria bacterium P01_H01_bin.15]
MSIIIIFAVLLFAITTVSGLLRKQLYNFLDREAHKTSETIFRLEGEPKPSLSSQEGLHGEALNSRRILAIEEIIQELPNYGDLIDRFRRASRSLEDVNTTSLVDYYYSQLQHSFFLIFGKFTRNCEKVDYFTKATPNALLSLGLLGTFLGIALNLTTINEAVQQFDLGSTTNIDEVIVVLRSSLRNMGIAFGTSLFALICSLFLTGYNLIYNTGQAKDSLISQLENLLDNVCQPTIEGNRRLDRAIARMSETQLSFLAAFQKSMEESQTRGFERLSLDIDQQNQTIERLVERFYEAAGTINNGGNEFKQATSTFSSLSKSLTHVSDSLATTARSLRPSADSLKESANILKESQFFKKVDELIATQQQFAEVTSQLNSFLMFIQAENRQTTEQLTDTFRKLDTSSALLSTVAETFENSSFATILVDGAGRLQEFQTEFEESIQRFVTANQHWEGTIQDLHSTSQSFAALTEQVNQISGQLQAQVELEQVQFTQLQETLTRLLNSYEELTQRIQSSSNDLSHQISASVTEQMSLSRQGLLEVASQVSNYIGEVDTLKASVSELNASLSQKITDLINENKEIIQSLSMTLIEQSRDQTTANAQNLSQVTQRVDEYVQNIQGIENHLKVLAGVMQSQSQDISSSREQFVRHLTEQEQQQQSHYQTTLTTLQTFGTELTQDFNTFNQQTNNLTQTVQSLSLNSQSIEGKLQKQASDFQSIVRKLSELSKSEQRRIETITKLSKNLAKLNNIETLLTRIARSLEQ